MGPLLLLSVLPMYINIHPREIFSRMSILILLMHARFNESMETGLHLFLLLKPRHLAPSETFIRHGRYYLGLRGELLPPGLAAGGRWDITGHLEWHCSAVLCEYRIYRK